MPGEMKRVARRLLPVLALVAIGFTVTTCRAQQNGAGNDSTGEAGRVWIDTRFPPYPAGVTPLGASTIGIATEARFSIQDVQVDSVRMLWLSRIVERADGAARFAVSDVLVVPESAQDVELAYGLCGLVPETGQGPADADDLKDDPEIVAMVRADTVPILTDVVRAWRADTDSGRFLPLEPNGIGCRSESYGL